MAVGGGADRRFERRVRSLPVELGTQHLRARRFLPAHPVAGQSDRAHLDVLRRFAHFRPEDVQRVAAAQQRRMPHVRVEQAGALLEAAERIARAVELPRHRHDVGVAVVRERPHVAPAEPFRAGLEVDAVTREGDPRHLRRDAVEAVVVHDDAPVGIVDVNVRRRDVRRDRLGHRVVRHPRRTGGPREDLRPLFRRQLGWRLEEVRPLDLQAAGRVNSPWAEQFVRVGEANVQPLVVREIEVVPTQRIVDPLGYANQRRTLDVDADARVQVRRDDRPVEQTFRAHAVRSRRSCLAARRRRGRVHRGLAGNGRVAGARTATTGCEHDGDGQSRGGRGQD